jgi:rubrerythrin
MSMNTETATIGNDLVPELAMVEVSGITRASFILRGAMATGSVYGAGMVTPFVRSAFAATDTTDVDILNFALTLEYLEAAFYDKAGSVGLDKKTLALAKEFGSNEQDHVKALKGTIKDLGGKPVKSPAFDFSSVTDQKSFLKLAQTLEDTGVSAYNGAAPSIKDAKVLGAAGSIVQVEARHAAAIRLLRDQTPAPAAFDAALQKAAVLKAIKPLIKS